MKSGKTGRAIVGAAVVGVLVLMLVCPSLPIEAVYPVERACLQFRRNVWSRISGMFSGASARAENVRLKRQVAELSLLRSDMTRLSEENARLRRTLDYQARDPENWLAACVLSTGGGAAGLGDRMRVDKGAWAGVRAGAVVVVPEGLVGVVRSVTPHTAEVALVTDPALKVACEIETRSGGAARGILSGGGEDRLVLRHLRCERGVSPPARVFTSGRGGVFPRGIEVGALLSMTNDVRGVTGEVRPRVDYSTLEDVFICRGK